MRPARASLLCALLLGCVEDLEPPPPPPPPEGDGLELRAWGKESEVAVGAAGEVPWVWGFQGGTMIRPLLVFPPGAAVADGDELRVILEHQPDPAAPGAFDVHEDFLRNEAYGLVWEREGELVLGPLDDQLAWVPLDDVRLTLRAEVEGYDAIERALRLYAEGPPVEHPCYELAPGLGGGGCVYAELPGVVHLTTVEEGSEDTGCGLAAVVEGSFEVGEGGGACLAAALFVSAEELAAPLPLRSQPASVACLTGLGHEVGTTSDATLSILVEGTCSPGPDLVWGADLSSCACP